MPVDFQRLKVWLWLPPLIVGCSLSCFLYNNALQDELALAQSDFNRIGQLRFISVEHQTEFDMSGLQSFSIFLSYQQALTEDAFLDFAHTTQRAMPALVSVQWLPLIEHAQRADFELQLSSQAKGRSLYELKQQQPVPPQQRERYYPVMYASSYPQIIGFDFASNAEYRALLKTAEQAGVATASSRLNLKTFTGDDETGILIFLPVYHRATVAAAQQGKTLQGFIVAALSAPVLIDNLLQQSSNEPLHTPAGMDIYLFDRSKNVTEQLLHFHPSRRRQTAIQPLHNIQQASSQFHIRHDFKFANRDWTLVGLPVDPSFAQQRSHKPPLYLLSGLLLSALLGLLLWGMLRRRQQIEQSVAQRTALLAEATALALRSEVDIRLIVAQQTAALREKTQIANLLRTISNQANQDQHEVKTIQFALELVCQYLQFEHGLACVIHQHGERVVLSELCQRGSSDVGITAYDTVLAQVWQQKTAVWLDENSHTYFAFPVLSQNESMTLLVFSAATLLQLDDTANIASSIEAIIFSVYQRRLHLEMIDESRQHAEMANRAKSDFLANMSHEIRTPMNAIIGLTDLCIRHTAPSPKQLDYLRKVELSAQGLLRIINDILDVSKIEAGKLSIEEDEFYLHTVLKRLETLTLPKAMEKGLELLFDCPQQVPDALIGDPLRLGQVLVNLVSNAIKFTEQGEIVLSIRCLSQQSNSIELEFRVQDQGIGISLEQQQRLFQPFVQADVSTTRQYGGSGLGLVICKRLVEMMQGSIRIESEQGKGACFVFNAVFKQTKHSPSEKVPLVLPADFSALIVDDSPLGREILQRQLLALGVTSQVCTQTEAASSLLAGRSLLLLDAHLAVASLTSWLQQNAVQTHPATVVLCCSFSCNNLQEKFGVNFCLSRPFTPYSLSQLLQKILKIDSAPAPLLSRALPDLKPLSGARILLVEDNLINQQITCELLAEAHILVDIANHGQQALERLEEQLYDAVLMDVQMPIMGGYEATRLIRLQPQYAQLPIIAMTANAMLSDQQAARAAGMSDYLAKPLIPDELFNCLLRWVCPLERSELVAQAEPVAASALGLSLPSIEGINMAQGLIHLAQNQALYLQQLHNFIGNQAPAISQLRQALASQDWGTAVRIAHTLKSVCGTLGMEALQQQAKQLEQLLKSDPPQVNETLLATLEFELASLISRLHISLPSLPTVMVSASETFATLRPQLEQLQQILAQFDSGAAELIDLLLQQASAELQAPLLQIKQAIAVYDFDTASERVAELLAKPMTPA